MTLDCKYCNDCGKETVTVENWENWIGKKHCSDCGDYRK